jgi:hypothetical protein
VNPCRYDSYPVGLAPENFAHLGYDGRAIRSGFDWGAGSLLAAGEWMRIQCGQLYIDATSQQAFGIDGIIVGNVERRGDRLRITAREATGVTRRIVVVTRYAGRRARRTIAFDAGAERTFDVEREAPTGAALVRGATP